MTTLVNLLRGHLKRGNTIRIRILSDSMFPTLEPQSLVSVRPLGASEPVVGDIIVFERSGILFSHRVVKRLESSLITRGDASTTEDPPITVEDVLGIVDLPQPGKMTLLIKKIESAFARGYAPLLAAQIVRARNKGFRTLLDTPWEWLLGIIRWRVRCFALQFPQVKLYFHQRYPERKTVAGMSDVDFTLVLENTFSPVARALIRTTLLKRAVHFSRRFPLLDPPYVLFEDEFESMKRSPFLWFRLPSETQVHGGSIEKVAIAGGDLYWFGIDELWFHATRLRRLLESIPEGHVPPDNIPERVAFACNSILVDLRRLIDYRERSRGSDHAPLPVFLSRTHLEKELSMGERNAGHPQSVAAAISAAAKLLGLSEHPSFSPPSNAPLELCRVIRDTSSLLASETVFPRRPYLVNLDQSPY